ncbi:unnamed protein product [Rhizopus microsporus]
MGKQEVNFISIPIKKPDKLSWTPALTKYITESYAEDAKKYNQDCNLLDSLRQRCLEQEQIENPLVLEDLSIYFNQLSFLGSKFPLDIGLDISWYPLFSSKDRPYCPDVLSNLNYEKSCVLLRMAAFYSILGTMQSSVSTEGIRKACQHFQHAAGCLKYIQSDLINELRAAPPRDFELLDSLIALMIAQAHECVWQKAVMEHMKYGTVARLAIKASDYYESFLSNCNSLVPDYWKTIGEIKHNYFKAVAQYQKANEAISSGRYGEEIARLYLAKSNNAAAIQKLSELTNPTLHPSFVQQIYTLDHSIDRDLIRAEKDNDVVYMETVPQPNQLAPILRSDMAKPILPSFILDPSYWLVLTERPNDSLFIKRPLFEKLVPFAVHQAVSVYNDKKNYIVQNDIIEKNSVLEQEYQKVITELRLPYSLDIIDTLPKELLTYAEEVQDLGGIQTLNDMLHKIQDMSKKALGLIEEGFNALEEENEQDAMLSKQYGKLWSRPTSRALTQNLLTMGTQYNDTIQAAQKADRIVQAKVANWGKAIAMLSRPSADILSHLPQLQPEDELHAQITQLLTQLRRQLELLEKNARDRQDVEKEVKKMAEKDDISDALMSRCQELTKGSPIVKIQVEQFSDVFESYLKKYQSHQAILQQHAHEQDEIIYQLRQLHMQLNVMVSNIPVLMKREKAISNLEAAYSKIKEIRTNLVEGIKVHLFFYAAAMVTNIYN